MAFLRNVGCAFDVIVSADTLCYFAALGDAIRAAHHALRPGEHVFLHRGSVGRRHAAAYILLPSGRYAPPGFPWPHRRRQLACGSWRLVASSFGKGGSTGCRLAGHTLSAMSATRSAGVGGRTSRAPGRRTGRSGHRCRTRGAAGCAIAGSRGGESVSPCARLSHDDARAQTEDWSCPALIRRTSGRASICCATGHFVDRQSADAYRALAWSLNNRAAAAKATTVVEAWCAASDDPASRQLAGSLRRRQAASSGSRRFRTANV